jgi:hypothetical protein
MEDVTPPGTALPAAASNSYVTYDSSRMHGSLLVVPWASMANTAMGFVMFTGEQSLADGREEREGRDTGGTHEKTKINI